MTQPSAGARYLSPAQVAALLQVSPKTVTRWAKQGKLPCVRTLGGHRRYPQDAIMALREALTSQPRSA
ncbi:MAG TPA: BldC family transcriptional regulator [Actinomycetes bacterium]|jgi:excisionase family DNA binding protein|nr:BldC family transcriptional regulator [Actinomycetes bacterium]